MDVRGAPLPLQSAPAPQQQRGADAPAPEILRVAAEFEAVFLTEMLQPMFANLDTEGLGGGGEGERMFRPMLIEQYAAAISQAGGVGIADAIVRELTRMQVAPPEVPDGSDR